MIAGKVSIISGKELFNKLVSELSTNAVRTIRKWPNGDFIILYANGIIDLNMGHDTDVIELMIYVSNFKDLSGFIDRVVDIIERNGLKTEDCVNISIHST